MGTRVALYLRQSLDADGTGLAVARQEKECRAYVARREGWQVVDVYCDNSVSASGRKVRKQFERMIVDARAGQFDVIVAQHMDRLTRSLKDYLPLLELAEKHGVGTTTATGELDLTTDMGQTLAGVLAVFANGEIKRKGRRQMAANQQRAEQGRPRQGGRRAFGYEADQMTVRESEAVHVRAAYTAVLAGASLNSIARQWNETGVVSTTGKTFNHNKVRLILMNPRNAGIRVHRQVEVGRAAWGALVDEPTFRATVALLSDPVRRTNNVGGERRRLMTGVGRCGVCNDGTTVLGGSKAGGQPVYRCTTTKHLFRKIEPVDHYVETVVVEWLSRPDAAELLIDHDAPDLAALNTERITLVARQEEAAAGFAEGLVTMAQMRVINDKTQARIEEIDQRMAHRDRERVLGELVRADDVYATWKTLLLERKQAVLRELGTWTINRGKVGGNPKANRYKSAADYRVVFTPHED